MCLLQECKRPKAQVIFQPGWVEKHIPQKLRECCCGAQVDLDLDMDEILKKMDDMGEFE